MLYFTHIVSTEHSGSTAFGGHKEYLNKLLEDADNKDEQQVLILADYFSMASLVPFYVECTNKKKLADKVKPVFGLKITIQRDTSIDFVVDEGDFLLDEKNRLIIDDGVNYKIILDDCTAKFNDDESFIILNGKKIIVDETNRLTDEGRDIVKNFKSYTIKKPLFGKDHDITLIAKNEVGRRNINKLISIGHSIKIDSDYKRLTFKELSENSEGLMMITGGKNGAIEEAALLDDINLLESRLKVFNKIFDKDDIYLQVQRVENRLEGQKNEEKIISVFKKFEEKGFNLFASNDVRFPKRKNYKDFIIRKKAIEKKEMEDRSDIEQISEEQYMKSTKEMLVLFKDLPKALVNTYKMTKKTDLTDYRNSLYRSYLPKFPLPEEFDNLDGIDENILKIEDEEKKEKEITDFKASKYLKHLSYEGLDNRWPLICKNRNLKIGEISDKGEQVTEEYLKKERELYESHIEMELEVIHRTGFPGYFLIVQDLVRWCKRNDIPVGPGRGSGAGSIVLYCLDITDIDSIEHELLFERFLNPERVGEPDIDIDFSPRQRQKVIKYMAKRYGVENTAQILTHGTMAAKDVVDNIGRVYGLQPSERDRIKNLISGEPGTKLKDELDPETGNELLLKLRDSSPRIKMMLDSALELEGSTKSYGKHAGGVVISYGAMDKYAGLYQEAKDQGVTEDESLLSRLQEGEEEILVPIVQVDKNLCETVGLIKFDILGLKNLDIIDDCIKFLNRTNPDLKDFKASDISPHDKKAIKLFQSANTYGIFQFESPSMRRLMVQLRPDNFKEVIALVALFRPGPLSSGMADDFVDRKHGKAKVEYPHIDLEDLLKSTYGTIIYQEQVMQISRILSGFTRGEADTLRKAMGKKIFELMQQMRKLFAEGAGHKYKDDILKSTGLKMKSMYIKDKKMATNIQLDDITHPYFKELFNEEVDEEHKEKIIEKFGYFGKFISTKEQVVSILDYVLNFSDDEKEALTVNIDSMKDSEFFKTYLKDFIHKGVEKLKAENYSEEEAEELLTRLFVGSSIFVRFNEIFSKMNEFAAYGFNESHSVAYASVSMQTAYLKAHYPAQYMSALLSNESNLDKLSITARECRRMGLNILKPDINKSNLGFEALTGDKNEKNIRYGLGLIKGIAKKAKPILELRDNHGEINDIYDFYNLFAEYKTSEVVKRKGIVKEQNVKIINKTVMESLLNSGALDCLCPDENSEYRPMLLSTFHHINNTFTDLKKRLTKNFNEIKRKINAKSSVLTYEKLNSVLSDNVKAVLNLNNVSNKETFINVLNEVLIPNDLTKYDLNIIFEIYNKADEIISVDGYYSSKDFLNAIKVFEGIDLVEKLQHLSLNMIISHSLDSMKKYEKSLKSLEKEKSKKTMKKDKIAEIKEKIATIIDSDEYKLAVFINDLKNNDKLTEMEVTTEEHVNALNCLKTALKNSQLKLSAVFDLESELKTSHGGEEIEMIEKTVKGKTNFYVIPTTKEFESVPRMNSKERTIKEYETTGMYQTTHPLFVDALSEDLKAKDFNIVPLSQILPKISSDGRAHKSIEGKHYLDAKVAGSVIEVNDFRKYNEETKEMETKISLVIDDGTGVVNVKFVAEKIFTPGREDKGIKMLLDMKKRKSDILLIDGSLTEGFYESEGATMYVNKIGSPNKDLYLPVVEADLNAVEEDVFIPASNAQIGFLKNLLRGKGISEKDIFESYGIESFSELGKFQAIELINIYNPNK